MLHGGMPGTPRNNVIFLTRLQPGGLSAHSLILVHQPPNRWFKIIKSFWITYWHTVLTSKSGYIKNKHTVHHLSNCNWTLDSIFYLHSSVYRIVYESGFGDLNPYLRFWSFHVLCRAHSKPHQLPPKKIIFACSTMLPSWTWTKWKFVTWSDEPVDQIHGIFRAALRNNHAWVWLMLDDLLVVASFPEW